MICSRSDQAIIPAAILNNKKLHPGAKFLFILVVSLSTPEGVCKHSYAYLADFLGVAPSTIRRWMGELKKAQVLSDRIEYSREGSQRIINIIHGPMADVMYEKVFTDLAPVQTERWPLDQTDRCSGESLHSVWTDGLAESLAKSINFAHAIILDPRSRNKKEELVAPTCVGSKRKRVSPPLLEPERAPMVHISDEAYDGECAKRGKEFVDEGIQILSQWKTDKHAADPVFLKRHKHTDIGRLKGWVYEKLEKKASQSAPKIGKVTGERLKMNQELLQGLKNASKFRDDQICIDGEIVEFRYLRDSSRRISVQDHGFDSQLTSCLRKMGWTDADVREVTDRKKILQSNAILHDALTRAVANQEAPGLALNIAGDFVELTVHGHSRMVNRYCNNYRLELQGLLAYVQAPASIMQMLQ